MVEIILLFIFLFLAVIGLCSISCRLWFFLIKPSKRPKTLMIIKGEKEGFDDVFMYHFEKYRFCGCEMADKLLFVSQGEPSNTVKAFTKAHKNMFYVNDENIDGVIKNILEE